MNITTPANVTGRVLLALLFVVAGAGKITGYEGTAAYMNAMGVPAAMLPLVIALELGGGLALIAGFQTRIVAFLLAGFSIVSAAIFHSNFADQMQQVMFLKNLAIAGGLLLLVANGAGALAVDKK